VTVYPRREVLDPQGTAIRNALHRVGFSQVKDVRAGKSFRVKLSTRSREKAQAQLDEMCRKLLANTVVEDYSIEIEEE
jgi:phosphoribosylformylglycinamidine synthase